MSRYISQREGAWRLWFRRDLWTDELWRSLRERLSTELPSRHPRTLEIALAGAERPLFLKLFYGTSAFGSLKDFFRRSKALRSLRSMERLNDAGFGAPIAIGAGEERHANVLRRSFVVTLAVSGRPLPLFLRHQLEVRADAVWLRQKRTILTRLAQEIRALHNRGFVHGDLVPGNIFVAPASDGTVRFVFMDNDRTCRYPLWLRHRLWKRNLVQLNRFPLAGISLQDRMRFFHAYAGRKTLGPQDRRLIKWLERRTRQRRAQCDAVDPSGSFRRLMRWDATIN